MYVLTLHLLCSGIMDTYIWYHMWCIIGSIMDTLKWVITHIMVLEILVVAAVGEPVDAMR